MIRIYVDQTLREGDEIRLPESAGHHLRTVLRLCRQDELVVFNGQGGEYHGHIAGSDQRQVLVRITHFDPIERESPLSITLAQAVSRGERMDYTIQKAVELGVNRIVPLATQHGVVRLGASRLERRREHWRGIIAHACEQSGRTRVPLIDDLHDLVQWADTDDAGTRYVLDPSADDALTAHAKPEGDVSLIAGAEGGFTAAEMDALHRAGYASVRLGPRVLRTETAAVAALAVLQSQWGDLG